jgi:hypothetical protein
MHRIKEENALTKLGRGGMKVKDSVITAII